MRDLEQKIGAVLARWVDAVRRRPRLVVAAALLGAAGALAYTALNLGIRGDTDYLLSPELPFKRVERRYQEAFPALYENMFIVIDASSPERAGEAATAFAERLARQPDVFRNVYLPGGGAFFERHAFLYLDTPQLEELADQLAVAQPYLADLSRDGTLRGLASMLARGSRAAREGDIDGERLRPVFEQFAEAVEARLEERSYEISWAEVLAGSHFEGGGRRRFLLVQPALDVSDIQPAKRAIVEARAIAEQLGLTPERGVRVRITGDVALSYEEMEAVKGQAAMAGVASFVLVGIILGAGLRSLRLVAATLMTLLLGLVYTAAYTALAIGHLNMISAAFAVLFIGLGVDFGIHLSMRYHELLGRGQSHADAIVASSRDVGSSLFLCAATTAIGFLAFVPTVFVGVAELGLISAGGVFISLFCTLTVFPALLSLRPIPSGRASADAFAWASDGLAALPLRHPRAVRAGALLLGLGAVFLLPKARFDNNPLNVRDPSSESVQTFEDLLAKPGSSPWSVSAVAPDLDAARELAERLRELDVVGRVVTLSDFIPANQDEKLGIIEDVALFLAPLPGPDGQVPRPGLRDQIASLRQLHSETGKLMAEGTPPELAEAAARLDRDLGLLLARLERAADAGPLVASLERIALGTLPEQLRILSAALTAGRVTLEKLPAALLERMVAADGRVRVEVFPREELDHHAALASFVDGVREVAPEVAGSASEILESGRAVRRALTQAMLTAVGAIAVFLLLLWRRVDDAALVLIPLCLAAALTVAAAVLLGIPFNFADVIVLPLLLGIGVDSGIHLVHRARVSGSAATPLLGTSTARAVAYSALTTIASFGTMGFAGHLGLATLGRLLTLGVACTLLCNLVLLPALVGLRSPRARLAGGPSRADRLVTPR